MMLLKGSKVVEAEGGRPPITTSSCLENEIAMKHVFLYLHLGSKRYAIAVAHSTLTEESISFSKRERES